MKRFFSLLLLLCAVLICACHPLPAPSEEGKEEVSSRQSEQAPEIPELPEGTDTLEITCVKGSADCWRRNGGRLYFSGMTEDTVCSVSGAYDGQIVIECDDGLQFELELRDVTAYSAAVNPIEILSGDKVRLTAREGSDNSVYDRREAIAEEDDASKSAIRADCDLVLGGTGKLTVISAENNGIHAKGDLRVQDLTLSVTCVDNALKGNDGVTVRGGDITLIATAGDGIKTSDPGIGKNGKQHGNISLSGGNITVYAARDGIDAAVDAVIEGDTVLTVYTDKYSPYSIASAENGQQPADKKPGDFMDRQTPPEPPEGGGGGGFDGRDGGFDGRGGGFDGRGGRGGGEANRVRIDYSAKGIKAGNEILISDGSVTVTALDDAIHANNEAIAEYEGTPVGNVTVSGGKLLLSSEDDGIHADGALAVTDGVIEITACYEGLEGTTVAISGGDISVTASDDGVNATAESGCGITITGGRQYIFAGGDGLDANSRENYEGILFNGCEAVIISTTGMNSAIDTERGYRYESGRILAIGAAGGMVNETVNCRNFASVGCRKSLSLKAGQTVTVWDGGEEAVSVKMPCALSAMLVYLGSSEATIAAD